MIRSCVAMVAWTLVVCSPGRADKIPDEAKTILEKAEKIELLSLNPEVKDDKGFHGWKVLGQTAVKQEDRAKLVAAFQKGVTDNKRMAALCFIPRHGLRASSGGKTADFVVCFECFQVQLYLNDKEAKGFLVTNSPQPVFDKVLKDAKVPLPKK